MLHLLLLLGCKGPVTEGALDPDSAAPLGETGDPDTSGGRSEETGETGESGETGAEPLTGARALGEEVSEDEIAITIDELAALGTRHTTTDGSEQARAYLEQRLAEYGLVAERQEFTAHGYSSANVVAVQEGAEDPGVVFIFSAHYDSTSNQYATTAPGADDNASGVAAVLEAARILSGRRFEHTLWYVFTGAEEQGSLGSAALVARLAAEGTDVRGVIAPDMIGYWPAEDGDAMDILGDADSEPLVRQMEQAADALGVASKAWIEHDYCYGDDHTNFQEAGYPAVSPMDCVEAHNVSGSGERVPHYHRTSDTPETVYLPFTARVAAVQVVTLAELGVLVD